MIQPEAELPKPPEIARRLVLNRTKLIGLPLLLSVPVLAILGVFGTREGEASAVTEGLEVTLRYPERLRYKMSDHLELSLKNSTTTRLQRVTVHFDQAYVAAFSEVHFTPQAARVSERAYEVDLDDIGPGETRRIHTSLQANDYGRLRGTVTVSVGGATRSVLAMDTLTFP
jgi:hypothetical protein